MMSGLTATGISVHLSGRSILDRLSIALPRRCVTGIIGPNGAGKSTLFKVLTGILPAAGEVCLDGTPLPRPGSTARARQIGYLPQAHQIHWPLTVRRTVALGLLPRLAAWQRPSAEHQAAVDTALAHVAMEAHARTPVQCLSGGERARVMLARVLVTATPVILADEPVAALDPAHQLAVMTLLRREALGQACAVGVIMQDLTLAARYCDRIILLQRGRVAGLGDPLGLLDSGALHAAYGIPFDHFEVDGCPVLLPRDESAPP